MFFWDNEGGAISIDAPESIKGFVPEYGVGQFGGIIPNNMEPAITAKLPLQNLLAQTRLLVVIP